MPDPKANTVCPNCGMAASREKNVIICETCDAEFVIQQRTRQQTLKTVGRIEQLENRVAQLEAELGKPEELKPETEIKKGDDDIL